MNLKNISYKQSHQETLVVIGLLLVSLFLVVVLGNKEQVIMCMMQIQWALATGIYLFALREMTNVMRLGWGVPRSKIHAKFLRGFVWMIFIMLSVWGIILGLFALRDEDFSIHLLIWKQIVWALASLFFLSEMGLLFGNCRLPEGIPFVMLVLLLVGLVWGSMFISWVASLCLLLVGVIVNIINHRLVKNIKVMRFLS